MLSKYLKKLQDNKQLTSSDYEQITKIIANKEYNDIQLGSLLVLITEKSLTSESLAAFAKNILNYSNTFDDDSPMIDVCGTGGDGFKTINISTTVAIILASFGIKVAKHGNRAVSSQSGSSDVLIELNIPLNDSIEKQREILLENNLTFFHAPFFHKLVGEVKDIRAQLGIRTVFNILGPLLHPNKSLQYQLVGIYHEPVHRLYAETLNLLGRKHAIVVRGNDGLDEITLCGETKIFEVKNNEILEYTIKPEDFGFKQHSHEEFKGGTAQENAKTLINILKGIDKSPKRDIVILNAMFAMYAADMVNSPLEAKDIIINAIDSGKVYSFFEKYIKTINKEVL